MTGTLFFWLNSIQISLVLKRFYLAVLVIALLLQSTSLFAQDFIYKHYDLQDGFPNPTVHAIFQDKDGFMWFATESGLCRYDGYRFKTYTVKDGLPGNEVMGCFQDSKGRMWLQFYKNNIAYLYNGKIYTQQNDSLLKKFKLDTRVFGLAEDKEGNIGICSGSNLFLVSPANKIIDTLSTPDGTSLLALAANHDGRFIMHSNKAVYRTNNGALELVKSFRLYGDGYGPSQVLVHKNYYTSFKVDSLYLKDTAISFITPSLVTIKYSAVCDSFFSVNTADGCFLYYLKDGRRVKLLPGKKVSNVYMDAEKNIWIGTIGSGVYKMSSQAIIKRRIKDELNEVWYINKAGNKIMVGNNSCELFGLEKNGQVKQYPLHELADRALKVLYYEELGNNRYITASTSGLSVVENGRFLTSRYALSMKQVAEYDKDHILIAIYYGLVIIRKADLGIIDTIWKSRALSSLRINDTILIGTPAGLFISKKTEGRFRIIDSLLPAANVIAINRTDDGLIWVCTVEEGLYCLQNGKILKHYTEKAGLPTDNGRSLHTQGNIIWLGTDKGLAKIVRANEGNQVQVFSTSDGMPSDIINSIYADGDTLYVGTPEGLCQFNQKEIETTSICNLALTGVRIGDELVNIGNEYTIGANQRFTIEFSGISFRSEQQTTYRYRINGFDDVWRNTELGSLEFTSLPGGDYELEIVAINKFNKVSEPLILKLHVNKPFHRSTWFLLLIIVVPVIIVAWAYNRRFKKLRERQLQKLRQQEKVIKLEQMALRAQMNPHFIFNCINAIQQLVADKDTANTHQFITSFSELVRQTLENAPELFIRLSEEVRFLTNYFELERIRLEDRFSYVIDTSNINDINQWKVPNMVIQPFVENAIRHGIRYKKNGPGFIEVRFEQTGSLLRCTITDNGIGREKAAELKKNSGVLHESKGMGITFKRIESLNAMSKGLVSIHVEDLKDENLLATGTRVTINFYKIGDDYDKDTDNR